MRCGISTACFYPEDTLTALKMVAATGAPVTEIFLNTFSELEKDYIARLDDVARTAGIQVVSLHPFSSAMEGFFFATRYAGRMDDGIRLYRRFFEAAHTLGADKLVFHGDHSVNVPRYDGRQYAQNFKQLAAVGREYGVALCHENVSYCRLAAPATVRSIRPLLGRDAAFVLDTKQVQRFGAPIEDMLDAMGSDIRHVHISDHASGESCLPPGEGEMDFSAFLDSLRGLGYAGDLIIEVYRDNFGETEDLIKAMCYVQGLL